MGSTAAAACPIRPSGCCGRFSTIRSIGESLERCAHVQRAVVAIVDSLIDPLGERSHRAFVDALALSAGWCLTTPAARRLNAGMPTAPAGY
jgi:hypothetical protein